MQQNKQSLLQGFPVLIQFVKVLLRAGKQDVIALQLEGELVKSLEELSISTQSIQMFKDGLEKIRRVEKHAHDLDIYIMGGILIYCGILLQVLMGLGSLDFFIRLAWLAFAVSFPCTMSFFLALFLNKQNDLSGGGQIHRVLATFAQFGITIITVNLFFHIWDVAGRVFILCIFGSLFAYWWFRWNVYYKPFLGILKSILKGLSTTPSNVMKAEINTKDASK